MTIENPAGATELPPPDRMIDIIANGVRRDPNLPAVSENDDRQVTYGELAEAVATAQDGLRALGVQPGDRIVVVNENSIAVVALLFAISGLDAWPVLVNARLSAREIDAICAHAAPRALCFTTGVSPEAARHAERFDAAPLDIAHASATMAAAYPDPGAPEPVTGDRAKDVAILIYTSGTTGAPKGVMLSHQAALFVASSPGSQSPAVPGDIGYCALPISHIYGLTSTTLRMLYGGAHLWMVSRFSAEHATRALTAGGVTLMQGVPQMYARLLEHKNLTGQPLTAPELRYATIGGAYVEPDLKAAAEEALGCRLAVGYGMTEFASTVTRSLEEHRGRDNTCGPPLPGIETKTIDGQGRDLPTGEVGEICLRGPNGMLGYYRNPEATEAVLSPEGWYRTGDVGRVDEKGYIHFVEREREVIIRSGFNVYPVEVEQVLTSHPDVTLAAVVGREVEGNEEIVAFVQPVTGHTVDPDTLAAWAADKLGAYKRPQEIRVLEALPAAATGKILKKQLREMAAET